jgi:hypothetical protein
MLTLIREGGVPIWFVLLFGLVCVGGAIRFAVRPSASQVPFLQWMMGATLFFICSGTAADIGTTFHAVSGEAAATRTEALLIGLGESMSVGIMGFALLAIAALIIAVGHRRLAVMG